MADISLQLEKYGIAVAEVTTANIRENVVPDKYTFFIFCTDGEAQYEFNLEHIHFTAGTLALCNEVVMVKGVACSDNFRALALIATKKAAFDFIVGLESSLINTLFENPVFSLTEHKERQLVISLFQSIRTALEIDTLYRMKAICGSLFHTLMLSIYEIIIHTKGEDRPRKAYNAGDTYFRNFISLINDHIQQEHEVAFYADKLNITPKYLNEICKQHAKRKAKEIISAMLVSRLKFELRTSGNSVKTIAFKYHFADQSSMGKFFRKQEGISPLAYRQTANN